MSCKNNSSNSSSESLISTLAAILKRLFSRPQSSASHLFAPTRSFHRPVSFRPAQTKPDSEINASFLSNAHGDRRYFFFQVFAKNSVIKNIFEEEKKFDGRT